LAAAHEIVLTPQERLSIFVYYDFHFLIFIFLNLPTLSPTSYGGAGACQRRQAPVGVTLLTPDTR
jgi:hypothetical protein